MPFRKNAVTALVDFLTCIIKLEMSKRLDYLYFTVHSILQPQTDCNLFYVRHRQFLLNYKQGSTMLCTLAFNCAFALVSGSFKFFKNAFIESGTVAKDTAHHSDCDSNDVI